MLLAPLLGASNICSDCNALHHEGVIVSGCELNALNTMEYFAMGVL